MRLPVLAFSLFVVACGCSLRPKDDVNAVPPSEPLPDGDGLGTPLGDLCAHLRGLGCREGAPKTANGKTRTCYATFTLASRTAPFDVACSASAKTPEEIRRCGDPRKNTTIRCPVP